MGGPSRIRITTSAGKGQAGDGRPQGSLSGVCEAAAGAQPALEAPCSQPIALRDQLESKGSCNLVGVFLYALSSEPNSGPAAGRLPPSLPLAVSQHHNE